MINFKLFNTLVKVKPFFFINLLGLWVITTAVGLWQVSCRSLPMGILVGFCAMLLIVFADLGHAVAHIFSARRANAPMDELQITSGMPRTIYHDNQVSPEAHRMRSLGGPIFSAVGFWVSLVFYLGLPPIGVNHELAGWSTLGHAFILFGAMLPLPVVDGGVILKWTLVINGKAEAEADKIIRRANWGAGIIGVLVSIFFLLTKSYIIAAVLLMIGLISIIFAARKPEA